jgi:hypothetical protein
MMGDTNMRCHTFGEFVREVTTHEGFYRGHKCNFATDERQREIVASCPKCRFEMSVLLAAAMTKPVSSMTTKEREILARWAMKKTDRAFKHADDVMSKADRIMKQSQEKLQRHVDELDRRLAEMDAEISRSFDCVTCDEGDSPFQTMYRLRYGPKKKPTTTSRKSSVGKKDSTVLPIRRFSACSGR